MRRGNGDGKYDVLQVETRLLKNPRSYDPSGIPFHEDGKTTVKERIYLDILHDDITTIDNVNKRYVRETRPVVWLEASCPEGNPYIRLDGEVYIRGARSPATRRLTSPQMSTHRFKGAEAPLTSSLDA